MKNMKKFLKDYKYSNYPFPKMLIKSAAENCQLLPRGRGIKFRCQS